MTKKVENHLICTYPATIRLVEYEITNPNRDVYHVRLRFSKTGNQDAVSVSVVRCEAQNKKGQSVSKHVATPMKRVQTNDLVQFSHVLRGDIFRILISTDEKHAGTLERRRLPFVNPWTFKPA